MKRPLSLIILAGYYLFSTLNGGLREALAHFRRGDINDGLNVLLLVVLAVVVCIGLLRLRRWAWWVSMLYFAAATCLLGVSVWHGNDHPVYLLVSVAPLIVLFSYKVSQAFFPTVEGDNLGNGKIIASTSSPAPPFSVSTPEATVPMKQAWLRNDKLALIAAIFTILQFAVQPFYNHILKQLLGIGN